MINSRVVKLGKQHKCSFYPHSVMEFQIKMRFNKKYPKSHVVFSEIVFLTLGLNIEKTMIDCRHQMALMRPKTYLKYIDYFKKEGIFLVDDVADEKFIKIVGLNPFKFGKLFPSYEEALESLGN